MSHLIFKVSVSNIKLLFEKVTFAQCCHRNSWQSGVKLLSTVSFLADQCFTLVTRFQLFRSWQFGISSFLHNSLVSAVLFMIVWCQQFCSWQFGVSIFVHDSLVSAVLLITVWCQQFCSWQLGVNSFVHNSLVSAVLFMIVWCQQFCSWQFGVSSFLACPRKNPKLGRGKRDAPWQHSRKRSLCLSD